MAPIEFEIRDNIAHCILSNPPKNEMNTAFFSALARLRADVFPTLKVAAMLLYGQGNHFSSGADLEELRTIYRASDARTPLPFLAENLETFRALSLLPFPVVALINGCCLGAGLELALACHFRIASPHAVFSLPETTFDLIPGCGGTIRLPKLVAKGKAIEMILSGRTIAAEEALAAGLIDSFVPKKAMMDEALELLHRSSGAPATVAQRMRAGRSA